MGRVPYDSHSRMDRGEPVRMLEPWRVAKENDPAYVGNRKRLRCANRPMGVFSIHAERHTVALQEHAAVGRSVLDRPHVYFDPVAGKRLRLVRCHRSTIISRRLRLRAARDAARGNRARLVLNARDGFAPKPQSCTKTLRCFLSLLY